MSFTVSKTFIDVVRGTKLEPRGYQLKIGTKTIDQFAGRYRNGAGELEGAAKSIIIESPTGSGKTPLALVIARTMQDNIQDLDAIWISMRRNLLKQASLENAPPSILAPEGKGIGAQIEFLSMFTRDIPSKYYPDKRNGKPLLFIIDECQHDAAATCLHLHNELKPDYILGLSATPYRTDKLKLSFEKVNKDAGIHQLIQDGYLSEYEHYTIPDWDPDTVADFYLQNPDHWGPSLIFFQTIERCEMFYERMVDAGIRSDIVTGNSDRETQLDRLKTGELRNLVNCMVFTEGLNYPDLRTVWTRDSGKGPTIQMAGRVFRKSHQARFKQVVQSKDTRWPMLRTATAHQQYVWRDNGWLTLKMNSNIERVADNTRMALTQVPNLVPRQLLEKGRGKGKKRNKF